MGGAEKESRYRTQSRIGHFAQELDDECLTVGRLLALRPAIGKGFWPFAGLDIFDVVVQYKKPVSEKTTYHDLADFATADWCAD